MPTIAVPALDDNENAGGANLTVRPKLADLELVAFVAVILYVVAAVTAVGEPEIRPVEVLKVSPAGNAGSIEKLAIAPPEEVTV